MPKTLFQKIVFTIIRFCDNVSLESEIESDRDDRI